MTRRRLTDVVADNKKANAAKVFMEARLMKTIGLHVDYATAPVHWKAGGANRAKGLVGATSEVQIKTLPPGGRKR